MKRILTIHTGGTISMKEDKQTGSVAPGEKNPLDQWHEEAKQVADITVIPFFHLPSPHITPENMFELSAFINEKLAGGLYDGIVITHGTDTLEETAYFLDLLHRSPIPIILTGAMRSSNELGADGPYNFLAAIRTASSEQARGKGVLVVMNDEVHSAINVTKTHSSNVATFQSPQFGPIGLVTRRGILFHHSPSVREQFSISSLTKKVFLLKAYAGMERETIDLFESASPSGLVIEAFGQGNVPPAIVPAIESLIVRDIPVVLVSRCYSGIVQATYEYTGGGMQLKNKGVIFSNGLNGQKARLKLMIALEAGITGTELTSTFESWPS